MGIEQFFSSIEKNKITNNQGLFVKKLTGNIKTNNLMIDFNSIIHIISVDIINKFNYIIYCLVSNKNNDRRKDIQKLYNLNFNNLDLDESIKLVKDKINQTIIDKVYEYILNLLQHFMDSTELKTIMIAVDGVPHVSKISEQKKRRYLGGVVHQLKEDMQSKHEQKLKNISHRYKYEQNKISWSKVNISPGTPFMNMINQMLSSTSLNEKIKNVCPNLEHLIISGTDKFGEGEKKITDYVYENEPKGKLKGHITVYSPDSDLTLLCLIMSNKINNSISILRYNQQQKDYELISIDKLKNNLIEYVKNKVKFKNPNEKLILDDIVFILTMFGNDFIPKIDSLNIKNNFNDMIDKYITLLNEHEKYIISHQSHEKRINQDMLLSLFEVLQKDEHNNLRNIYMSSMYHNYNRIKRSLDATSQNFIPKLESFLAQLKKFNNDISQKSVDKGKYLNDQTFIQTLMNTTRLDIDKKKIVDGEKFVNTYIEQYNLSGVFPRVDITLKRYSKSINNVYYQNKLNGLIDVFDKSFVITDYDKEVFQLDYMLDEYYFKLSAYPLEVGIVWMNGHQIKFGDINSEISKHYQKYFHLPSNSIVDRESSNFKSIMDKYLEGLVWVFDYYFNNEKTTNVDVWYYSYSHSPLLQDIFQYLRKQNKDYIGNKKSEFKKYQVSFENFFNPVEHMMYTSPVNIYRDIVPKEYKDLVDNMDFYKSVSNVLSRFRKEKVSSDIICTGVHFLNKCHVTILYQSHDIVKNYQFILEFITYLRKVHNFNKN